MICAFSVNFTVSTGTALSADGGNFTIPITIDGKTFNKIFSWSCSKQGTSGVGIKSVAEHYAISSSNTTVPTSWSDSVPTMTTTNKYLWNYETITYTNNTTKDTEKRVIGAYGDKGATGNTGETGNGISKITNYYLASSSSSGVTTSTSGWTTSVQSVSSSKKYLWNYEVVTYTNGSTSTTTPCIIGTYGDKGDKGDKGNAGNDAYTVILTNENHTFNAEQNGNISSAITTTTKVIAYKGATSVTPTIGTLPSVGGLTLSKASDGVTINIQANTGTSLAANGKFDIPITVDGKSFTKVFSWSKVNKGTNAYSASIGASSQVFKSMDGGKTFTPSTITLTPILQNLSFSKWQYSTNGGSSFTDVASGSNGLTVSSNKLTISKDSSLFTTSISSLTFKLVTNNSSYYDTMTVVKLNDIGELELGGRNYILYSKGDEKLGFFKNFNTVNESEGYGEITLTSKKTYQGINIAPGFVLGCRDYIVGKKVVFSYDIMYTKWDFPSGSNRQEFWMGQRYTNTSDNSEANGKWKSVTSHNLPVVGENGCQLNKWYHVSKVITIPTQADSGVNTEAQIKFYNSNESVSASFTARFKNVKLEYGNIETDWSPAPEDGIDYTDRLVNDLRNIDLQDIIELNNQAINKIDSIIQDGKITPNEKVDLQAEFARIKVLRDSTKEFYNTVNDTTLSTLLNDMETTYQNVKKLIDPVISNMTTTSNASASEIRRAFIAFYEINQSLLTALQQSVAILSVKNSTSIEALEEKVSITASKQTEYATKIDTVTSHLDFTQSGFVEIYATTNGTKGRFSTQITDQKLAFKDNGEEVAYISNQEMYITKATITDQMQIGNFIIKPSGTAKGGIMFIHIDNA